MNQRVQVEGPQRSAALQTVARPNATPVGRQQVGVSRMTQLARSLEQINPQIRGHLREMQAEYEQEEAHRAYDTLQGMTFDEAKKMVESGTLRETENPWYEAAFMKQFGISYAGKRKRDILNEYETAFDKHNGDIEEFIASRVQEDASKYGDNKYVASGLREGMGDFLTRLRDSHAEFKSGVIKDAAEDQFLGASMTVVDEAIANHEDPSAAVRSLYGQHRQALGLTYEQMDANVMKLAAQYAEAGDLSTTMALLETDIVGEDGQPVGSFTNRSKYAGEAQRILNKARKVAGENHRKEYASSFVQLRSKAASGGLSEADVEVLAGLREDEVISQEMYESMLLQNDREQKKAYVAAANDVILENIKSGVTSTVLSGRGYALTDITYTDAAGDEKTVKRDTIINEVVNETLTEMAKAQYPETQMAATLASWGVGATFEVWENALTDGYVTINQSLRRAGPDGEMTLPEPALAAYGTWKNLSEHPNLRARHVKDTKALQFYQDAEALERGGMDPESALLTAARIDRNSFRQGASRQIDNETLSEAMESYQGNGWWGRWVRGRANADNLATISGKIEETANILVEAGGISPTQAVHEAARIFEESHVIINGVAVNHRNKLIPEGFSEMATDIVEEYAETHGLDASELTLVPNIDGEQNWLIVNKSTYLPENNWREGGVYSITDIQNRAEQREAEARQRSLEAAQAAVSKRKIEAHKAKNREAQKKGRDMLREDRWRRRFERNERIKQQR